MTTLRLLTDEMALSGHEGEMFCCAYSSDSGSVLSAGWDGHLRYWNAATGMEMTSFPGQPQGAFLLRLHARWPPVGVRFDGRVTRLLGSRNPGIRGQLRGPYSAHFHDLLCSRRQAAGHLVVGPHHRLAQDSAPSARARYCTAIRTSWPAVAIRRMDNTFCHGRMTARSVLWDVALGREICILGIARGPRDCGGGSA